MDVISFSPIPSIKPINEPNPDLNAPVESFPAMASLMTAPANAPRIIPTGEKMIPTIIPMVAPHIPALVPPNFFAPQIGMR